MRKAIGLLTLVIGLAVLATPGLAPLEAQDKAKTKKDEAKAKDKKGAAKEVGTIEIYKAKDGFRYRVKDADGKTLAMPARGHESKNEVIKDLDEIKAILDKAKPVEVKE